MNKQKFTKIVKEYHSISAEERNKLHELVQSYPYSQVIHTLVAKANMDAKTDIAKQTLAYAAMYSADRSVLKEIISVQQTKAVRKQQTTETAAVSVRSKPEQVPSKVEKKKASVDLAPKVNKITIDPAILKSGEPRLSDMIMKDLDDLKQSKASYMEWLNLPDEESDEPSSEKTSPTKKATKTKKASKSKATTSKTKSTAKKEKAVKAKTATKTKATSKKTTSKAKASKSTAKPGRKTAQKTSSSNETSSKQPDQSKIIEKFIAQEPSITAKASRKSPENQEDLSIASTSFNEDLVSENLAKILISQGKSDKAIDIYKKLIWKFPQKKAYFASQIEELKNKK